MDVCVLLLDGNRGTGPGSSGQNSQPSFAPYCAMGGQAKKGKLKTQIKKSFKSTFYLSQHLPEPGLLLMVGALPPPDLAVGRDLHIKYPLPQTAEAKTLGERKKSVSSCFPLHVNKCLLAEHFLLPKAFVGHQLFNIALLNPCVWLSAASPISEQGCWHFVFRKYISVFR